MSTCTIEGCGNVIVRTVTTGRTKYCSRCAIVINRERAKGRPIHAEEYTVHDIRKIEAVYLSNKEIAKSRIDKVMTMKLMGFSYRAIGRALGISHSRAHQIYHKEMRDKGGAEEE